MKSSRLLDRRLGFSLASLGMLLGVVSPALVPAFTSAAAITTRSIELSSATAAASNVTYDVTFTPATNAAAVVLDFCSDSPIYGQTCTAPVGFDASSATVSGTGATRGTLTTPANSQVEVVDSLTGGASVNFTLSGVTNPTNATTSSTGFYARIVTFDTQADANAYASTGTNTGKQDDGGVALAITDNVGVSAAVRESMTFCVSKDLPSGNCGTANDPGNSNSPDPVTAPTLTLGQGTPPAVALDSSTVSTGDVYAQLSTNAASGAVVNLKSDTTGCGGMVRAGAANCDITPATYTTGISAGQALFGVKVGSAATDAPGVTASGTFEAVTASHYNSSTYNMNYTAGDTAGVTSTYGDPILDTNSVPVSNKNMKLTFGASASNTTPAGLYKANLSLVATGTY